MLFVNWMRGQRKHQRRETQNTDPIQRIRNMLHATDFFPVFDHSDCSTTRSKNGTKVPAL